MRPQGRNRGAKALSCSQCEAHFVDLADAGASRPSRGSPVLFVRTLTHADAAGSRFTGNQRSLAAGEVRLTVGSYQQALEIDPEDEQISELLGRLKDEMR